MQTGTTSARVHAATRELTGVTSMRDSYWKRSIRLFHTLHRIQVRRASKKSLLSLPVTKTIPTTGLIEKKSFVVFNGVALVSVGSVRRVCVSNRNSGHVFDDRVVDSSRSVAPICYLLQHHEPSAAGLADILVPGRIRCWPATVRSAK